MDEEEEEEEEDDGEGGTPSVTMGMEGVGVCKTSRPLTSFCFLQEMRRTRKMMKTRSRAAQNGQLTTTTRMTR